MNEGKSSWAPKPQWLMNMKYSQGIKARKRGKDEHGRHAAGEIPALVVGLLNTLDEIPHA